jgi:lipopolysaccharide biosynthesis glycosyltransferase
MVSNKMHIALCFDDNYLMAGGVLISSILYTNKNSEIVFHIITEHLSLKSQNKLQGLLTNSHSEIKFYTIDSSLIKELPLGKAKYISIATYIKLFIPIILPQTISKVLYLDSDMVVIGALTALWNIDIADYPIGATIDSQCDDIRTFNRIGYINTGKGHFNTGMVLFNTICYREQGVLEKALLYIKENPEKLVYPEQDVLNFILAENWKKIVLNYNLMSPHYYYSIESMLIRSTYFDEIREARENPVIIHYAGSIKPWHKECCVPLKEVWFFFKSLSPWKNERIIYKYHGYVRLRYKIRRFLEAIHVLDDTRYLRIDPDINIVLLNNNILNKLRFR